jgi:phospholipid/cholesterol/gamma-HCH transport system permease protein
MMPILALVGMWSAVVGGWIVAVGQKIPSTTFIQSVQQFGTLTDVGKGMLKAPVFGLIIAIVACREGLYTTGGAEGVGRATTRSVVISTVLVYVANFVLAQLLFQ